MKTFTVEESKDNFQRVLEYAQQGEPFTSSAKTIKFLSLF